MRSAGRETRAPQPRRRRSTSRRGSPFQSGCVRRDPIGKCQVGSPIATGSRIATPRPPTVDLATVAQAARSTRHLVSHNASRYPCDVAAAPRAGAETQPPTLSSFSSPASLEEEKIIASLSSQTPSAAKISRYSCGRDYAARRMASIARLRASASQAWRCASVLVATTPNRARMTWRTPQ